MILQHFVMPDPEICDDFRLYIDRNIEGGFPVGLETGESVVFGGFVNAFSLTKWRRYCNIGRLTVDVDCDGHFVIFVRLCNGGRTDVILEYDSQGPCSVDLPEIDRGMLSVDIRALSECVLRSGSYSSDVSSLNEVRIGVDVCTYRRENYVKMKIRDFGKCLKYGGCFAESVEMFIIDNASELEDEIVTDPRIHLFHNPNTGGSGGFSRGIVEIEKQGGFTHVMLMDDDTIVEPESIYRTWAFISVFAGDVGKLSVGGAMLLMDRRCVIYEAGATFRPSEDGIPRCKSCNHYMDVSDWSGLGEYDADVPMDYFGWWMCTFPMSFANSGNLPLNFFIKYDDVEYGLRWNGLNMVINGVFAWHLHFDPEASPAVLYYGVRNHLILLSLMGRGRRWYTRKKLRAALKFIKAHEYSKALAVIDGVCDTNAAELSEDTSRLYIERSCHSLVVCVRYIRTLLGCMI